MAILWRGIALTTSILQSGRMEVGYWDCQDRSKLAASRASPNGCDRFSGLDGVDEKTQDRAEIHLAPGRSRSGNLCSATHSGGAQDTTGWTLFRIQYDIAAMSPAAGMVRIQAHTIRPARPQRTAESRFV